MEVQYLVAWLIYIVSGGLFTWVVIVFSRSVRAWLRDLIVGSAMVLIFTPWHFGDSSQYWAPALLVLLMDVLLEGTETGLQGGVVILCMTTAMVGVVLIRMLLRRRKSVRNIPVSEASS